MDGDRNNSESEYKTGQGYLIFIKVQFPRLEEDLPDSLLNMKARGLDIRFVEGDIRSHKNIIM